MPQIFELLFTRWCCPAVNAYMLPSEVSKLVKEGAGVLRSLGSICC